MRPGLRCVIPRRVSGGEADGRARVARRWRLVGRQFGRIAAVSQLFSVLLFPQLFSTLHCALRSAPADALPVHRSPDCSHSPFIHTPSMRKPPLYGKLFVIIAFPPTNEAATTAEQITGKSILLFPPRTYRVVVTGRSSHAVRLRSTFFLSGSLAAVLFMPAPLLPPDRRRLPKRSRVPTRDDVRS